MLISIRKLAALDLVFHGPRFVLIEFGGAVVLTFGLAVLSLRAAFSHPGEPVIWEIVLGILLASIGANYLPLLVHAASLIRSGTAREEVKNELEQSKLSQRRYGTQQFLLLVPFAILVIAVAQISRRTTQH
ncbi:MAG TPA: hypothetical protein VF383_01310 [Candidatus Dormibacteraeota bacterium]